MPDVVVFTQARIADHKGKDDVKYLLNIKNQALQHSKSQNFSTHIDRGNDINWDEAWNLRNNIFYLKDNYKDNKPIVFKEWYQNNISPNYPKPINIYMNAIFAVKK